MRDISQTTRTPMKQSRINHEGTGEVTCEAEEEELEFVVLSGTRAMPNPPLLIDSSSAVPQPARLPQQPSSSRLASSVIRHQMVLLIYMLTPQGTKFMAKRTEKGILAIPTIETASSPTTKDAVKTVATSFINDRFPFRLIPGIRIGRKSAAAASGGSWHFHIGSLDAKISLDVAALLATQGVVWLPSIWLANRLTVELKETWLTEDVDATLLADFCSTLATDKQPHSPGFRNLLLASWAALVEADLNRRQHASRQPNEDDQQQRIQVQLGEQQWTFMTIYAPSEPAERRTFLEELPHIVPPSQNVILAGDFNLVLQPGLNSPLATPLKMDAHMLLNYMEQHTFIDAYRCTHPTDHGYTWFSSQRTGDAPPPKWRLDLLLTKGAAWESLTAVDVMITPGSDHRTVMADFLLDGQLQRGPGIFRLNTDHLDSPEVLQWVANHWRDWQTTKDWFDSEEEWTAVGFRAVTRALDVFSRIQARGRRRQEEECLANVKEAEDMLESGTLTELYWLHRHDKWLQKWEDFQIEQQICWANRATEKGIATADRMTKETFKRICPQQSHSIIRELQHPFLAEADTARDSMAIGTTFSLDKNGPATSFLGCWLIAWEEGTPVSHTEVSNLDISAKGISLRGFRTSDYWRLAATSWHRNRQEMESSSNGSPPVEATAVDTAAEVTPSVVSATIVGAGRVGAALEKMGKGDDVVVRRGGMISPDGQGPILVCTRNADLDAVVEATPPSRREDLVFFQNGMIEPWLASKGLEKNTVVLVYFAVAKLGDKPVDGKTDVNPEGLTAAKGIWATAVASRLHSAGLSCKVLDAESFRQPMLEKLIWISAFMLVGTRHPGATVGDVESTYRDEVVSLVDELAAAAAAANGVQFDDGLVERLCAYARSVAHYPTAIKEFEWRNGWFYSLSKMALDAGKPDPCPLHTAWLMEDRAKMGYKGQPKFDEGPPDFDPANPYADPVAFFEQREYLTRERFVKVETAKLYREKVRNCYRQEGVNHLQNCREIVKKYLDAVKEIGPWWGKSP
ncbi:hypothetical protein CBR_g39222 [Chara braunii]|uniref:Endonuclease/exonuclease/phosphatase domain-containing protein n=1 Tax=Chara braunii TaxID=69332 RepID=A0A388LR87_CHABU|nr:hypothetical protein CBR_g39222 [Chara braunii]|eukprot:GBG84846.1 hypothetical protein CBR_g39222 [Chara braunii]